VGIVGHRPHRLKSADLPRLSEQLRRVLGTARDEVASFGRAHGELFSQELPALRAVTPLAEGTDRLFARAAIELGYELCCPMPFPQLEFEADFRPPHALVPDSVDEFRALLDRAARETTLTRFEMDGDRADPAGAYGACGSVVMNQSDLLVVVWDGEHTNLRGGTEETMDEARGKGVPILWMDARAPHDWQMVPPSPAVATSGSGRQAPAGRDDVPKLVEAIRQALELPDPKRRGHANGGDSRRGITIADFFAERRWRVNPAPLWRGFRGAVGGGRWSFPRLTVPEFERAVEKDWPRDRASAQARVVDRLRPFYAWCDKLSVTYADIYRSTFILAYTLAGLAVGMALLPLALGWNVLEPHLEETLFISIEFLLILIILLLIWRGHRRRWHERWIDYRLAAELVRHLRLGAPLGNARPFPQVPAQWASYGEPGSTWMAWYVRAVERDLGLPAARLDLDHVRTCARDLAGTAASQLAYHRENAERSHRIEARLHAFGLVLLGATLVACACHLLVAFGLVAMRSHWRVGCLVFLAGFLPALGAALAGINNQGEFRRVARRSDAMQARLRELMQAAEALVKKLESAAPGAWRPRASGEVTRLAHQAAHVMVNEVLDWRVVFLDQPLKPS